MNWLAHLFLSEKTPDFLMGNLLPDFLRNAELQMLPPEFGPGILQHRMIDAFTDSHPIVLQSRRRLSPPYRRYAGIVVDMFYDHLLATNWHRYSAVTLDEFTAEAYALLQSRCDCLPDLTRERLEQMIQEDWLGSYRHVEGIQVALERIGSRLSRPIDLGGAVPMLEEVRESFIEDFEAFFPLLRSHVSGIGQGSDARELRSA